MPEDSVAPATHASPSLCKLRVANSFDAVAIGVTNEGREVGLVVLRKELWLVDDLDVRVLGCSKEGADDLSVRGGEREMEFTRLRPPRGADPERSRPSPNESHSVAVRVFGADAQWREEPLVEHPTSRDIPDLQRDMVEHGDMLTRRRGSEQPMS